MGKDMESGMAQVVHQRDLIPRHRTKGEVAVMGNGIAITAQVRQDHAMGAGQFACDPVPHRMGLRIAVQQQDRIALPADQGMDRRAANGDVHSVKAGKQCILRPGAKPGHPAGLLPPVKEWRLA